MIGRDYEMLAERQVGVPRPELTRDVITADQLSRDVLVRGRQYRISDDEARVLFDVGRFRILNQSNAKTLLADDARRLEEVLRSLCRQRLLDQRTLTSPNAEGPLKVVTLTKRGLEVLSAAAGDTSQRFYSGFVKPREVPHDTAIYQMFQAEALRIQEEKGTLIRVVLDYELKREIFSLLEKRKREGKESVEKQRVEVAARFGLAVVNGKIPLPDLRIEYRALNGDAGQIDLELSTGHYKASQLAAKTQAGFRVYHLARSGRLGGTPHSEDLLREVFSR